MNELLKEACDKLRVYLEDWYKERQPKGRFKIKKMDEVSELGQAKRNFMIANPQYQECDRDILFGFKGKRDEYGRQICYWDNVDFYGNLCDAVIGIVVEPINWDDMKYLGTKKVNLK